MASGVGDESATFPSSDLMWAVDVQLKNLELLAEASTYEKAKTAFDAVADYALTGWTGTNDIYVGQLLSDYVGAVRAKSNLRPLARPGAQLAEG